MASILKNLNPKRIGKTIKKGFEDQEKRKAPIPNKVAKRFKRQSEGSMGMNPAFSEALGYKPVKVKVKRKRRKTRRRR